MGEEKLHKASCGAGVSDSDSANLPQVMSLVRSEDNKCETGRVWSFEGVTVSRPFLTGGKDERLKPTSVTLHNEPYAHVSTLP